MEFSKQFIEVIDALGKRFGIAIDWANKNVVPYLTELSHRIINYEIATSCVWLVMSLLVIGLIIWGIKKIFNMDDTEADFELVISVIVTGAIFSLIPTWIAIEQMFDIVTALTLPEKTILEFLQTVDIPSIK